MALTFMQSVKDEKSIKWKSFEKKMLMQSQAVGENFKIPTNEGLRIFRWYTTHEKLLNCYEKFNHRWRW